MDLISFMVLYFVVRHEFFPFFAHESHSWFKHTTGLMNRDMLWWLLVMVVCDASVDSCVASKAADLYKENIDV